MRQLLQVLAILALTVSPVLAGPNAGGVLTPHDAGLTYTSDSTAYPSAPPIDCASIDTQLPNEAPPVGVDGYIWKIYAVFPTGSSPRLKALPIGEVFDASVIVITGGIPDPVADFEIPQGGWPTTSGGGVGISFGVPKTDLINEVYWLAGYSYPAGSGGVFHVAPHPVGGMVFVDDSVPPVEDPITGLGSIGFGVDGERVCPTEYGACCLTDGTCVVLTQAACATQNGTYMGNGVPCSPDLCGGTPVEDRSWGRIKAHYR